ncbi:DUF1997 domain-containing protein [Synechococcus sp. BA-124 BA4]|jgi:hypothetical protein|uniref:DUF1997 domain-containing protein n=1 Tax=unclassified Synechococcus TaxID=2626047 RepID=UPI0018CCCE49|nr:MULTISPECIES: DUF1997 domain-containing protein [unclassified Synechococcus]MEA5398862.1 DUF1997 domain-containing protein [Synechococcus sp. BA-124 BA4]QPN57594.1 DUF1997 domain-containing protein [Synechococcus sp. CBW1107]CAK6701828.1 hypothetical protein BBFGKLBO_03252 [Synechococcus sp. CBW1107]
MTLAFSASQQLSLAIEEPAEDLVSYLDDEERVIQALLDPSQLTRLGPGHYRYDVTRLQVFQLQIKPVVQLRARRRPGRLELEAVECHLEGLGLVDDFQLNLTSWLEVADQGLEGAARMAVSVSRPPMLRLIAPRVLEATGRSLLGGVLLGIRTRVSQQLLKDFSCWREGR